MQRAFFMYFLISALLTGCSAPALPPDHNTVTSTSKSYASATPNTPIKATIPTTQSKPPINILEQSTLLTPSSFGTFTLKKQHVAGIMLDGEYLYWFVSNQKDTIYRALFNNGNGLGKVEKFITSKYQDGDLTGFSLTHVGNWLVYFDHDKTTNDDTSGELRAKNAKDGTEKVIFTWQGNFNSAFELDISTSNEWIAWSHLIKGQEGKCDESVLGVSNLNTDQYIELNRACTSEFIWTIVGISDEMLVAERDFPDDKGGGSSLYLYSDIHSNESKLLATGNNASMPVISSHWVVWKNTPRFEAGHTNTIYNVSDQSQQTLTLGKFPRDPQVTNNWVYWISDDWASDEGTNMPDSIYLYDLEREEAWKIPYTAQGGFFDNVAIYGQWIVWNRTSEVIGGDAVLEWAKLP